MRKLTRSTLWMLLILASLWTGGFLAFLDRPAPHQMGESDAAVVLTGGAGRIEAAVGLLENAQVQRVLISGVNIQVRERDLEHIVGIPPETLSCCVDLGRAARNTWGNAEETAAWVRARNYQRITVVTADYHMPRSLLIFAHVMPDIALVPHSVSAPASVYGKAKEYSKYILTLLAMRLGFY